MAPREREAFSPVSFRDPAGRLYDDGQRILRTVAAAAAPDLQSLLDAPWAQQAVTSGRLIPTQVLTPAASPLPAVPPGGLLLEHPRLLASFAHEWPAPMVHAAAELTLDLMDEALKTGLGLKDATPANVLFAGTTPTFVDVLSFERRHPNDPHWQAYSQFSRLFLLPLLAHRETGLPMAALYAAAGDGLSPEVVYDLLGPWRRLLPPALGLVSLPTWLGRRANRMADQLYEPKRVDPPQKARYILDHLLRHLRRSLDRVRPVLHHLVLTAGVPVAEVVALLADLTTDTAVVEWVPPTDPMARALLRGRPHLADRLDLDAFESACQAAFDCLEKQPVGSNGRILYLLKKRHDAATA